MTHSIISSIWVKTKTIFKTTLTCFSVASFAFGAAGCSSDSTNAASNRDDAATKTTTSRRAQGLDAAHPAPSSDDVALSGDITQDTSAIQDGPLNTSPSDVNGLPPAGDARETTSGTTSGAITTEKQVEKKTVKKNVKKSTPVPQTPAASDQEPMEAPTN